jgi:hypothetical protein
MSDMWATVLDRSLYDHPGAVVTMRDNVRRYQDRPALKAGDKVTIVSFKDLDGQYGPEPRVLVRTADGRERWISAAAATDYPEPHGIVQQGS